VSTTLSAADMHAPGHPATGAPVAKQDSDISRGDILVELSDAIRNAPLAFCNASALAGWAVVANGASASVRKEMRDAGWVFFLMAGKVRATALRFDESKALRAAMKRLARDAGAQSCNALAITRIRRSRLLGVSRVSISAQVRHFQKGSAFFGR